MYELQDIKCLLKLIDLATLNFNNTLAISGLRPHLYIATSHEMGNLLMQMMQSILGEAHIMPLVLLM